MRSDDNEPFRYQPDQLTYAGLQNPAVYTGREDQATFIGRNADRGNNGGFNEQSTYYSDMSTIETRRSIKPAKMVSNFFMCLFSLN